MRAAAALFFVAAVAAVGCGLAGEFQVSTYPTVEAAKADRLFERGWLPDVLPGSAGPIVEVHDLDSNARCSRSDFPAEASAKVVQRLRAAGFESFRGGLPALPFSTCPFSLGSAEPGESLFRNAPGTTSGRELAVVAEGVLLFWSS